MERIVKIVLTALVATLLCTGCDLIRSSLGKPTSADIERIRGEKAAREQAVRDSIAAVEAEKARIAAEEEAARAAAEAAVVKRYYAVAGAFKEDAGAQVYIDKLVENGFKVRTFDFKSGLKVVCIDGTDDIAQARADLARLKALKIAPSDPWIYNTDNKLHKE